MLKLDEDGKVHSVFITFGSVSTLVFVFENSYELVDKIMVAQNRNGPTRTQRVGFDSVKK